MEFIAEHLSAFLTMGLTGIGAILLRMAAQKYAHGKETEETHRNSG